MRHISVLHNEALEALNLSAGKRIVDATLGDAGHAEAIAQAIGKRGMLIGIDADPEAILRSTKFLDPVKDRVVLVRESFANIAEVVKQVETEAVDGVLFDLGWSTPQFEDRGRGFSFMKDEPLNMRFDGKFGENVETAASILKSASVKDLTVLFSRYGEEKRAAQIAKAIADARRNRLITTSGQLAQLVEDVYKGKRGKIHPATQVFQALRIAVNSEFEVLKKGLTGAVEVLTSGGRLVVISFHSGEDRIVKRFMQMHPDLEIVNKKPIVASEEELKSNPKSRSAKLRIAQKSNMRFTFTQRTMKRLGRKTKRRRVTRWDWRSLMLRMSQMLVLRIAVFASIAVFGVGYIVAMSNVSTKGYEMREVERKITSLKEENQKLRLKIAQHRSLHSIQNRIADLGLVPVSGIRYVSLEGSSVAQR